MCVCFVCVSEQAEKLSVGPLEGKMMTYGISFQWFAWYVCFGVSNIYSYRFWWDRQRIEIPPWSWVSL